MIEGEVGAASTVVDPRLQLPYTNRHGVKRGIPMTHFCQHESCRWQWQNEDGDMEYSQLIGAKQSNLMASMTGQAPQGLEF